MALLIRSLAFRTLRPLGLRIACAVTGLLSFPTPALADATAYIGTLISGGARTVVGVSLGAFPRETGAIIGFEIDYLKTGGDLGSGQSSISVLGGSLLVQSNLIGRRLQIYGGGGGGLYQETTTEAQGLREVDSRTAINLGGGVKITLAGPLKIRVDYRLFFLGDPLDSSLRQIPRHPQRVSAGLSLAF